MKVNVITSIVLAALFTSSAYAEVQSGSINTQQSKFTLVEDTKVSNYMEPVVNLQANLESSAHGTTVAKGTINSGTGKSGKVALQWDHTTGDVAPGASAITFKDITSDSGIKSRFQIMGTTDGYEIPTNWIEGEWITRPTDGDGTAQYFVSTVNKQNYSGVYVLSTIATTWTD